MRPFVCGLSAKKWFVADGAIAFAKQTDAGIAFEVPKPGISAASFTHNIKAARLQACLVATDFAPSVIDLLY